MKGNRHTVIDYFLIPRYNESICESRLEIDDGGEKQENDSDHYWLTLDLKVEGWKQVNPAVLETATPPCRVSEKTREVFIEKCQKGIGAWFEVAKEDTIAIDPLGLTNL